MELPANQISPPCDVPPRPHILFIGPYPPPYSGPELGMKQFLESSLKEEFDIRFVRTNYRRTNREKGRLDISALKGIFVYYYLLLIAIVAHRPKLVYYPITPTQLGWVGRDALTLMLCRTLQIKTVIHLRGGHLSLNLTRFSRFSRWLVHAASRKVTRAIVQAERLRDQFHGLIDDDRVRVMYQAIDKREYQLSSSENIHPHRILFLGHLTKAKGFCDLVRALPILADEIPDVELWVAGTLRRGERGVFFDQSTKQPITYEDPVIAHDRIRRSQYARNYRYLGVISDEEKIKIMYSVTILVLPSYSEGFSRAVLEAMALGKAIVCSPVGAHPEVLEDGRNGYLVPPGDVKTLAERLIRLCRDEGLCLSMGRRNRALVSEKFDIEIIANQLSNIFHEALGDNMR